MTSSSAPHPLRWLRIRLVFVAIVLTALFVAIGHKAWTLQIRDGAKMRALGEAQYRHEMVIPAPRGTIHDRNGVELAVSVDGNSVEANPRAVVDVAGSADALARALALDPRDAEEKLGSGRRFVWIARRITPEQADKVRALKLPGVQVVAEPRRFYPLRELAGPLLGSADLDGRGVEGVELSLDEHLRGERSRMPAVRDGRGQLVLANGWDDPAAPAPGELATAGAAVTLTIDRAIQFSAERALADAVREHKARGGVVVVLDPTTGEVLALAVSPTTDPNAPSPGGEHARNRAVTDAYEPGSIMKVFSIAAAIDADAVEPSDRFDVEGGRLQIGRKLVTDTHKGERWISVGEIMKYSSNVGSVKIARRLGRERLEAALRAFGFGRKTGVELPGERSGRVRDSNEWREIGLATVSYGYGFTATPLQIAVAMAAIANGGELHTPTLVKRIVAPGGRVVHEHVPSARRVISEETSAEMVAMLQLPFAQGGTAEKIRVPGFALAGKTGTAHKLGPDGKYAPDRYLSSFVGFAPADDPRLVVIVIIDEPSGGKYYGGTVAGPVFARVVEEGLKYLGVPGAEPFVAEPRPEPRSAPRAVEPRPDVIAVPPELDDEAADLPPAGPKEAIVVIPDFTGLSAPQVLAAAHAAGVDVELAGSGRAVAQFPAPGRALKSITCRVTLDPM